VLGALLLFSLAIYGREANEMTPNCDYFVRKLLVVVLFFFVILWPQICFPPCQICKIFFFLIFHSKIMKNWAKKHILLSQIRVKCRKKDRSRPFKDKQGHLKFRPSFKGHIKKKNAGGREDETARSRP
jgi:hypothetical protein